MILRTLVTLSPFASALSLAPLPAAPAAHPGSDPCVRWAHQARQGCRREAQSEFWLTAAACTNLPTRSEQIQCVHEAWVEVLDAFDECDEQLDARVEVCGELGGGIYHPEIDPADFVRGGDNPYFPLVPGTTYLYEKRTDEGLETVEVTITHDTKEILGVACTAVEDVESIDGEVAEHTIDWFAQDRWGNVWYFGELSIEFEDGELVGLEGSWIAGEDGAKPGIVMPAAPAIGDFYRLEFLIGEAEDVAGVLGLSEHVEVPYGRFDHCLKTIDFSPLEPGNFEHKLYAPGVGLVLEVDVASGERLELVDVVRR